MSLIQKTVYFREEDIPKWGAVLNKAQWLHDKLNDQPVAVRQVEPVVVYEAEESLPARVVNPSTAVHTRTVPNSNFTLCKNGHPIPAGRGKCFGKGCKYA